MPRQPSTHVDYPASVGRRLRAAREKAGLSQRQLSFPGCSPAYISRIEAGDRIPSLQLLRGLGQRLGVSEDYLATGQERGETFPRSSLIEAEVALRLDETEVAERLYREQLERAAVDGERAQALAGLGQVAFRKGDPKAAITHLEQASELLGPQAVQQYATADTLGRAYALIGELEAAVKIFEGALEAAQEQGDTVETMRFAVLLANALVDTGHFQRAEALLGRISSLVDESGDPLLRARLYWSQSRLHSERGDPDTGAYYARRALHILQLSEHDYYTARAYQLLAYTEIERGRPAEALVFLEKGWPALAKTGNRLEQAQFRLEEARALAALGRSEEAGALAMELTPIIADAAPEDAGRGYSVLAQVFEQIGEDARALELYELAAKLLEKNPNRFLVIVYDRIAAILERLGRRDEAFEILQRAVRFNLSR